MAITREENADASVRERETLTRPEKYLAKPDESESLNPKIKGKIRQRQVWLVAAEVNAP